MRNTPSEVRRLLLRKGFGRAYASRAAEELAEHQRDLVAEFQRQGLPPSDAEREAHARLGQPGEIADDLFERMQATSFLARHPTSAFAVLALMLTLVWWVGLLSLAGAAAGLIGWNPNSGENIAPRVEMFSAFVDWIRSFSYVAVPLLCCCIARNYFCGWKPALWACFVAIGHNLAHRFEVTGGPGSGTVTWSYTLSTGYIPDVLPLAAPLLVFAIYWTWNSREKTEIPL